MRLSLAFIRVLAFWLGLSAGLRTQQLVAPAGKPADGLIGLALHALAAGRNGLLPVTAEFGVLRSLEFCCVTCLFLLLTASVLRTGQVSGRIREQRRVLDERNRELEICREQLRIHLAHDVLTGMLNRAGILGELAAEMDRTRREGGTALVALVNLDHFKRVNDAYGYQAGDEALRWFSAAVGAAIRVYDHAGRYGGDEFLLVLTDIPQGGAEERLTSLHASVSNLQIQTQESEFGITCSMGATAFDPSAGGESPESLLAAADQALYTAKKQGRNRAILHCSAIPGKQP